MKQCAQLYMKMERAGSAVRDYNNLLQLHLQLIAACRLRLENWVNKLGHADNK